MMPSTQQMDTQLTLFLPSHQLWSPVLDDSNHHNIRNLFYFSGFGFGHFTHPSPFSRYFSLSLSICQYELERDKKDLHIVLPQNSQQQTDYHKTAPPPCQLFTLLSDDEGDAGFVHTCYHAGGLSFGFSRGTGLHPPKIATFGVLVWGDL